MTRCWPNYAPAESAPIRSGLFPQLTGLGSSPVTMRYASRPFESSSMTSRAERAQSPPHRGVPDDELHEWHTPVFLGGGDAAPVVDAELVEPEPERTDLLPRSNAERTTNAGAIPTCSPTAV